MEKTKPNILVIDDEKDMLDTFSSILKKNYNVIPAISGREGLERFKKENLDLVLLDIRMPEMDGVEVLKRIKEQNGVEVIVVTASRDIKSAVSCMKLGAYDYITKPFEVDELLALLERALERRSLIKENIYLKAALETPYSDLIGRTPAIKKVFEQIESVAKIDSTVLITGESGTGKELVARAIHKKSHRANKPFVAVNCAAIPDSLLESELFGYERGAFTGAFERKLGKFEIANSGTIFLDEIGCMSTFMQAKLLRVLEDKKIERVGGITPILIDVRIISATNIDFEDAFEKERFRRDLYFRLNVIPIAMPSLRERREDIPLFLNYFLEKYNKELNKQIKGATPDAINAFLEYEWPGNVRELQNIIERAVALGTNNCITREDLPIRGDTTITSPELKFLKDACLEFEKKYIKKILNEAGGNQTKAAKILGIHRTTLISKMEALGLRASP